MSKATNLDAVIRSFIKDIADGHPWIPGAAFIMVPGLDDYLLGAMMDFKDDLEIREHDYND